MEAANDRIIISVITRAAEEEPLILTINVFKRMVKNNTAGYRRNSTQPARTSSE